MNEYSIGMWYGIRESFLTTEEDRRYRVKEVIEAGFTMISLDYSVELNKQMLKLCDEYGLKANIWDRRIPRIFNEEEGYEQLVKDIIDDYSDYQAVAWYSIKDEPVDEQFDKLARIVKCFYKYDSKHIPYINLLPNCAVGDNARYEDHLDTFIQKVKPKLVSYDHYSFLKREVDKLDKYPEAYITKENRERNGWQNKIFEKYNREGFFDNLETFRNVAARHDLPWMNIVLTVEHWLYRYLNEAEIRWEVFNSLAYGSDIIGYFTYWTPPADATGEPWSYHHALISSDGVKEEHYYMVKAINEDVKKIVCELKRAHSCEVMHIGPEVDNVKPYSTYDSIDIDASYMTVGFFKDKDYGYAILVNKDIENEQNVDIKASDMKIQVFDVKNSKWKDARCLVIAAGDAGLIRYRY